MGIARGKKIVTDGLVLAVDAANNKSYPGSGTTWSDLSGNGNTGTLTNGPTFDSGNNGSIQFDGVDDYVSVNNNSSINTTSSFTINCFFKLNLLETLIYPCLMVKDSTGSSFGTNQYGLWIWRGGLASRGVAFRAHIGGSTRTVSSWSSSGGIVNINATDLVDKWSMLTGTYDGSSMRIYLDAILVGSISVSGVVGTVTDPLVIGRNGANTNNYSNLDVSIAQVYNRGLTEQEILQNYNATKDRFGI